MRMDASFYKNVEGLTFDHAIHKSEKSFLQKNDFASIKYFPVEKHSF